MKIKLTKKQTLIVDFINNYTAEHGISPTYREIMSGLGLSSVSAVAEHIDNLVAKGVILKSPGAARSLEIIDIDYPETTTLFARKLATATPEEADILCRAAEILGLDVPEETS